MALQPGRWHIDGNGFERGLNINSVDAHGRLNGNVFGSRIQGFWDDREQKITFLREINRNDPSTYEIYTGGRFQSPRQSQAGQNISVTSHDLLSLPCEGGRQCRARI